MGYHSTVSIEGDMTVRYINHIINEMCQGADVVIAASQSGTVPYDTPNIAFMTMPQMAFLMGLQPDAALLCVNPYDDAEYVHRTIRFIESAANCRVLMLILFPFEFRTGWSGYRCRKQKMEETAYRKRAKELETEAGLPVLSCVEDMAQIAEMVMRYLVEA